MKEHETIDAMYSSNRSKEVLAKTFWPCGIILTWLPLSSSCFSNLSDDSNPCQGKHCFAMMSVF